jgi:hypothetical protein
MEHIKYYIHAVYMHIRPTMDRILRPFLNNKDLWIFDTNLSQLDERSKKVSM